MSNTDPTIDTKMLWMSSQPGWPLRIIHNSNDNLSFTFYVDVFFPLTLSRLLCILCLFVYSGVKYVSTIWVTWRVFYKRQELLTLCEYLGSPPIFAGVLVLIVLVFCVFCFVCLCPVYPSVSVYRLSILDCPLGFLSNNYFTFC
jgi:hypothetical protein